MPKLKGSLLNRALMNERKGSINKIELFYFRRQKIEYG
jgi:hypothetical protein